MADVSPQPSPEIVQTEIQGDAGPPIVRMEAITKRYPGVAANQNVHLRVGANSFHAVVGENGAGKSTLLNILYGRTHPDDGKIFLMSEEVTRLLRSPADAIRRGVALVSQHYALIPALTVLENIMLGAEQAAPGGVLRPRQAADRATELAARMGLYDLQLHQRADRLSVAAQQKVEILKALYRGARLLLLDEPTATLAPREADALFVLLHTLVDEGATIIFVTHKLREVMTHSNRVTVLRAGRNAGDFETARTSPQELLHQMIGPRGSSSSPPDSGGTLQSIPASPPELGIGGDAGGRTPPDRPPTPDSGGTPPSPQPWGNTPVNTDGSPLSLAREGSGVRASPGIGGEGANSPESGAKGVAGGSLLKIEGLTVRGARGVEAVVAADLTVAPGEIVGVAGVDGSGQRELAEAIVGLRRAHSGRILLDGVEIQRWSVRRRETEGIAYIPEDRHRAGMILDFTVGENYLLGHEMQPEWGGGPVLRSKMLLERTGEMLRRYQVRAGERGAVALARTLSGGNQQKVVVARALDGRPRLLAACQPTRGLDVGAAGFVYETLRAAAAQGLGVLLFSFDLDEVLEMSDRVAVMYNGRIAGTLPRGDATPESVGALMTGMALPAGAST